MKGSNGETNGVLKMMKDDVVVIVLNTVQRSGGIRSNFLTNLGAMWYWNQKQRSENLLDMLARHGG